MGRSSREERQSTRPTWETLEAWVRVKVQEFVQAVLEEEGTEALGRRRYERRDGVDAPVGHRNGYGKPRRLALQTGTIVVRRPRVRGLEERFESRLLPRFVRRSAQVADLLPELYLHELAQGDVELALRGLLGDGAPWSAKSIARLRAKFEAEYERWKMRPLDARALAYAWADGIAVRAGRAQETAALLVIIGARRAGHQDVLAVVPGYPESTDAWRGVLRDRRDRGLSAPKLVVADGAAGVWAAAAAGWPEAAAQRCGTHTIVGVLDQRPRSVQPQARELRTAMPYAATRAEAERRRDAFVKAYGRAYPKAGAPDARPLPHREPRRPARGGREARRDDRHVRVASRPAAAVAGVLGLAALPVQRTGELRAFCWGVTAVYDRHSEDPEQRHASAEGRSAARVVNDVDCCEAARRRRHGDRAGPTSPWAHASAALALAPRRAVALEFLVALGEHLVPLTGERGDSKVHDAEAQHFLDRREARGEMEVIQAHRVTPDRQLNRPLEVMAALRCELLVILPTQ
jgi:putative transposase